MRTLRDHPRLVRHGVAAIVLAAVVIVPFHAIFAHPGSRMVGVGDGTGTLRKLWAASTLQRTPLSFDHDALLGAPEGSTVVPAANLANGGVETAFIWELKGPLGLVGAYNAFMFLGLFATGLALYAFLTYLGCTFGASLLGGAVFALSPYAVERAYAGHAGFMHNWIFVLLAWLMLRLAERRSWRVAAGAGLALALAFYLSAYQALLGSAVVFAFLVVDLVRTRERGERLRVLARGAVI